MKEHPLLMKGPLVRATLEGRKTQTRRPVKPQPNLTPHMEPVRPEPRDGGRWVFMTHTDRPSYSWAMGDVLCPFGRAGDRLWVRETWRMEDFVSLGNGQFSVAAGYKSDGSRSLCRRDGGEELMSERLGWRPSIHMQRWASRITLPLVSVRVERAQDITEDDAIAEGVPHNSDRPIGKSWCAVCLGHGIVERFALGMVSVDDCSECDSAKKLFRNGWISIYGQESWDANPWVWVAQWERIEVSR